MAKYKPIGFKNEVPSTTPLKYKITDDTAGVIAESATIELETPVTPGTPLNAENLNHIEQGIVDLEASTPPGVFQAKGDLFIGAGSKTGVRLPIGANGRVLLADNTQTSGMRWGYEYLRDMIAAKGDLLVGTSADSAARLPVGADGRVLRANSTAPQGVEWGVDPAIDLMVAKGDLVVGTGADQAARLPVGANGRVLRANSAAAQGVEWGVDPSIDMIAAKGDLVVGTGADSAARLPVGANGQVLRANSAKAQGVEWGVDPAIDLIAAKGDLVVGTGTDTATRLPVGVNGQVLMVDSSQATGIKWATPFLPHVKLFNPNYSLPSDTIQLVDYTVEELDSHGFANLGTNLTRITIPAGMSGVYLFMAHLDFAGVSAGEKLIQLRINGGLLHASSVASGKTVDLWHMRQVDAGQYLEITARQASGATVVCAATFVAIKL